MGREHRLYDLDPFESGGICFMAQNMVHLGKCSRWTCERSTGCPMNYEVFPSGCWEQEIFPPNVSSSFISSFPHSESFPGYFSYIHTVTRTQLKTQGQSSPELFLCAALSSPLFPLRGVRLLCPAQTQSFPSSLSKATLVAPSLCGHVA